MQTSLRNKALGRRAFLRSVTGVIGIGLADAVYEPHSLDVTSHEITLSQMPRALDGFRIALLTDLHRGPLTPDGVIQDAVDAALGFRPDAVALTGDFIRASAADVEPCARLLAPLAGIAAFACLGNHDYTDPDSPGRLGRELDRHVGAAILRNASREVAPGLFFAGIEDTIKGRPNHRAALADVPPDAGLIFLTHNPTGVLGVRSRPSIALSGHTHGGQVRVPGRALWLPPGMAGFPIYEGWGRFGESDLYISRGVGQTAFGVRLCCPPEVSLITLRAG